MHSHDRQRLRDRQTETERNKERGTDIHERDGLSTQALNMHVNQEKL